MGGGGNREEGWRENREDQDKEGPKEGTWESRVF